MADTVGKVSLLPENQVTNGMSSLTFDFILDHYLQGEPIDQILRQTSQI
jgi:hypothetical protein